MLREKPIPSIGREHLEWRSNSHLPSRLPFRCTNPTCCNQGSVNLTVSAGSGAAKGWSENQSPRKEAHSSAVGIRQPLEVLSANTWNGLLPNHSSMLLCIKKKKRVTRKPQKELLGLSLEVNILQMVGEV